MHDSNRNIATSWFEQVWNSGDESAIDRFMSPATIFHGLPFPDGSTVVGPAGFKPFFQAFRQAFPDINVQILRLICEGDLVACHCRVTGTHTGPGLGVDATSAPIDIDGMVMAVIRDGRIEEAWNCFDFMSLYQKIGMLPKLSV